MLPKAFLEPFTGANQNLLSTYCIRVMGGPGQQSMVLQPQDEDAGAPRWLIR